MQKIKLCLTALSPITHQRGTVGNESLINSEPVMTPLGTVSVPHLSGNCLRHMLRSHWADTLQGDGLTKRELSMLYSGGNERSKGDKPSLEIRNKIDELVPGISLLGASLAADIVPGRLSLDRAMLVCRENASRLQRLYPDLSGDEWSLTAPAVQFVGRWQYYRHDVVYVGGKKPTDEEGGKNESMPFGGSCVIPGAVFLSEIRISRATPVEIGCVLRSLINWQKSGGVIGGQGSRGHGRLDCEIDWKGNQQQEALAVYDDFVAKNRDETLAFIKELCA